MAEGNGVGIVWLGSWLGSILFGYSVYILFKGFIMLKIYWIQLLTWLIKLQGPMHYKIGVTCVYNGHMF